MPRIGVTASDGKRPDEYLAALEVAGAQHVVLPNRPAAAERDVLDVDGILVTGGLDVDPALYGASRDERTCVAAPERDAYERALLLAAREREVPTLAICRGLQIANVAFGGTLVQHVPCAFGGRVPHERERNGRAERGLIDEHVVRVAPDSLVAAVLGLRELVTGSRHHQAVGRIAADLCAVAWTADACIEAAEARFASPFWVGVQWHPESTVEDDGGASRALFAAFVAAARR